MSGTSMATPHVAAAMALLKEAPPESSVDDLVRMLKRTGHTIRDRRSGVQAELIDIGRAVGSFRPAAATGSRRPQVPEMTLEERPAPAPEEEDQGWTTITE